MARLELRNLFKSYDEYEAVRGINLQIENHEFVVFVGPSGCGKSTTLRMIAGLEPISGGEIVIGDKVVNPLGPGQRDIAMVFQNYALYPHMTVRENMSFCLQQQRLPKAEIALRVGLAAATLHIGDLMDRRPGQLSGGQRQRVAMGRAIVRNPKVFLFDEPLSNLDAQLRVQMRTEIKRLHQLLPTTTVYVTHDQIEAMTMADRVVVMNAGLIEQVGPPQELYHRPASKFVAGFIGSPSMNFLAVDLRLQGERLVVRLGDGCELPAPDTQFAHYSRHAGRPVVLGLRPESITERQSRQGCADYEAKIDLVEPLGSESMVYFRIADASVCARVGAHASPRPLSRMPLSFNMDQMHLFDAETGRSLASV